MEKELFSIVPYTSEYEGSWDDFVMRSAVGGTFLQTRRFLNYHPEGRFTDASFLIMDQKNHIAAVCPGCSTESGDKKVFVSHKGSTFGGLLTDRKYYKAEKVLMLVEAMDTYLKERFDRCELKLTLDLYSGISLDLLKYCLQYHGYSSFRELNSYLDLKALPDPVYLAFDRNKNRNIEKCEKQGLSFRTLQSADEIRGFHELLTKNLEKYGLKPIHSVDEIEDFRTNRLQREIRFYGVFLEEKMMAAGMMFVFEQTNAIHAQNLSADYTFTEYSPITYLYYKVIEAAKNEGFSILTWGISTENKGREINLSLMRNKESYGSLHTVNETFYKEWD